MAKTAVTLASRLDLSRSDVILNGMQAIVRLLLTQKMRDEARGLDTAGFVSGYRGSPLGNLDTHLTRSEALLRAKNIRFNPGINEELAATSIWGAQQASMRGEGAHDGVFCVWYGKGPGVDRCGDVFRHANSAGSAAHGGVLVLMGDDHGAESSTVPHQSEFTLIDAMMPILNPAGIQDLLDYGVLGYALSRYSGCWVGLKCVHETIESTETVDADPWRTRIVAPEDFDMPEGGLNIRPGDDRFTMERRLHEHKRAAAQAFARANGIDRIVWSGGASARLGVVSTGKSWRDTLQALEELGIDEARAASLGLRLLKIGMVWPLEPRIVERFAEGLDVIIVVEEKRAIIETQMRELLFNAPRRPRIVGKTDEAGRTLLPAHGTLDPLSIARVIGARLLDMAPDGEPALEKALRELEGKGAAAANLPAPPERAPWFCAGCPHNSSTVVPEGARAYAGIGCHWLVQLMEDRNTQGFTQMGCEGANWIGEAPFSRRKHIFQNMGDGTYVHSGLMAIRACRAAGVNITFKILYNDAVAMTGGQPMDGGLSAPMIAEQARAEGCERIAVVSDEPEKWAGTPFPSGVSFHHRREILDVQREMERVPGVSILIYDQTCAAEKRRRRKRGLYPDPKKYVVINEALCEGCGDCGVASNCVAIVPVETPAGRKRRIDQSVCNRDYTCLEGFCPAMVTVENARPRAARAVQPPPASTWRAQGPQGPFSMLIAGIGGTGVVTIGQIIAQAAHIEGLGAGLIDMSGISQKNGTVFTHLKIAPRAEDIAAIRAAAGGADAIIGCDMLTTASERILYAAAPGRTRALVNSHQVMPARFTHDPDMEYPAAMLKMRISAACGEDGADFLDFTELARALLGDAIFANILHMGAAWRKGLIPVSGEALEEAIHLNGVAVERNLAAFRWGAAAAEDPAAVLAAAGLEERREPPAEEALEAIMARGEALLRAWGGEAPARDYRAFVEKTREMEARKASSEALTRVVARQLARLMAVKDEYEVARLYADSAFREAVARDFQDGARIHPHFAPPLFSSRKRRWPAWTMRLMPLLAGMRFLRGGPLDIFGMTRERRAERAEAAAWRKLVEELLERLTPENHGEAVEIAAMIEKVRGFGPVREKARARYEAARDARMEAFRKSG